MAVGVAGGQGLEIVQSGGIFLRSRKPSATHSVLIWHSNRERGWWCMCGRWEWSGS